MRHLRRPYIHLPFALLALIGVYSCKGAGGEAKEESTPSTASTPSKGSSAVSTPGTTPKPTAQTAAKPEPIKFDRPEAVRGIYLTAWSAGSPNKMGKMFDAIDRSEINAVVIDVRDSGEMYWKTGIPLAKQAGAEQIAVTKPKELMERLKKRGVYPIARIACFRDQFVPKFMPSRAVQRADGTPWRDHSGHMWLDPYNHKNWDYVVQTVEFALDQGFPEIQLDYVRFPSEGKSSTQRFPARKSYPDQKANPSDVITRFCEYVVKRVHARNAVCSADIFGIISSGTKDQGIGQTLEKIAKPFDLVCPMVYPSHYAKGEYGIADPSASPYAIIHKSLGDYKRRIPNTKVRPWLQDFFHYTAKDVQAQIKASRDLGYNEYLLWNAGNKYTWSAVAKPKQ